MSGMDALSNDVSVEEFLGHYEPWMAASWRDSFGDSLLCRALMNHDPTTRVVLANGSWMTVRTLLPRWATMVGRWRMFC